MPILRCSKQLSSRVQRGEQLKACWVIPFPKENYIFGEQGLGKGAWSALSLSAPSGLGWQEERWLQQQRSQQKCCKPQLICKHPWLLMRIPT